MKEKSFYIYKFLSDCLPIYALYTVLFKEEGLSLGEIALLLSFWSLIALILELPSGILADRWSRRYMIAISAILKAICYIVWFFCDNFLMFGLGFFFWGVASAFASGTEEGLIYDNLKSEKREKEFNRIYGRGRFFGSLGILTAIITSGFLATLIGISNVSLLSAIICLLNLIFIYQLKEKNYYSERLKEEKISYLKTFSEAIKLCLKNSKILITMAFLIFIVSTVDYLDEFDALIIDDLKLTYIWISAIFTIRFIFVAIGNYIAPLVEKTKQLKNKMFILAIMSSVFLLSFSIVWHQYTIFLLGISCMMMTITEVIEINAIQAEIKEEGRTTIMSLYSIGQNIVMIIFSLTYGLLSGFVSLQIVYLIISVYCIVGVVIFSLINLAVKKRIKS